MLPPNDANYLSERGIAHSVATESNMTCIVLKNFPLPAGFDCTQADLLLRFNAGYPDIPPDMWWFDPPIQRADKQLIEATDVREPYLGRTWQRWSRHLPQGLWRSGVDGLESFIALVRKELQRSVDGDGK